MKDFLLINDDCLKALDKLGENSVDAIVTDPPYGLVSITKRFGKEGSAPAKYGKDGSFARLSKGFMGKEWDGTGIEYSVELWEKCLRVLKPGGYLLSFGGTRTFHRIACAIEDAGFEIRDTVMWVFGSGMPKSLNIGLALDKKLGKESIDTGVVSPNARPNAKKENSLYNSGKVGKTFTLKKATNEWEGWGTGLKPAYEPIIMARKPFKGTLVDNVLENGVGGINIEECRVPLNNGETIAKNVGYTDQKQSDGWGVKRCITEQSSQGRHPADLILTYDENNKDEVYGGFPESKGGSSAARYFYCAKASSRDRDEGLEHFVPKEGHSKGNGLDRVCEFCGTPQLKAELCKCPTKSWVAKPKRNTHPTVKPTSLMQYLVRLVTPKGGVVLDPFMGSGSTGKAVAFENKDRDAHYKFIGIEKELEYYELSEARIEWAQRTNP